VSDALDTMPIVECTRQFANGREHPMTERRIVPRGEDLRRAVRWIAEQGDHSPRAVEDAARRFDLSPLDEEFLLRHFAERRTEGQGEDTPHESD